MKRLAAFKNPEFYRLQAMRQSTYREPPIISCSEETPEYLCLREGATWILKPCSGKLELRSNGQTRPIREGLSRSPSPDVEGGPENCGGGDVEA